jgi:hypothetical protein
MNASGRLAGKRTAPAWRAAGAAGGAPLQKDGAVYTAAANMTPLGLVRNTP